MGTEIAITVAPEETRVAVLDNGVVTDLFGDRAKHKDFVGNIYKGKVAKVLPGMQAAFVDVGLEKAAFMHVSDFWRAPSDGQDTGEPDAADADGAVGNIREELRLEPSLAAYVDELDAAVPEPAMNPDEVEIF